MVFSKKAPKHLNSVISQKLKGKEKRARVLKRVIAKSLSKSQKYTKLDSDLISKVSQIVAQECSTNPFF